MTILRVKDLILEKDQRKKMISLGVPSDVAEYLHAFRAKQALWFAKEFLKMPGFVNSSDKMNFVRARLNVMTSIRDWIVGAQNIRLNDYDWNSAANAANEWHKSLTITHREYESDDVIRIYENGFYWVDIGCASSSSEKNSMGHCGSSYFAQTLFSLRKKNNITKKIETYVTLAVSPNIHTWHQCKGRFNSKPKNEYFPYIADILMRNDIYIFSGEHAVHNDFNDGDFLDYLKNNPNTEGAEEFIKKIEEKTVNLSSFEKVLNDAGQFSRYSIDISEDQMFIFVNASYTITVPDSFFGDFSVKDISFREKDVRKVIRRHLSIRPNNEEPYVSNVDGNTSITFYLETADEYFSMDENGLKSFTKFVERVKENDSDDDAKITEEFIDLLLYASSAFRTNIEDVEEFVKEHMSQSYIVKDDSLTNVTVLLNKDYNPREGVRGYSVEFDKKLYSSQHSFFGSRSRPYYTAYEDFEVVPLSLAKKNRYSLVSLPDVYLIMMFWDSVKEKVFGMDEKQKEGFGIFAYIFENKQVFSLKRQYEYPRDENIDVKEQIRLFKIIDERFERVNSRLKKFYKEVVTPYVRDKTTVSVSDLSIDEFTPGRTTVGFGSYLETFDSSAVTPDFLEELVNSPIFPRKYKPLDTEEVQQWLDDNISDQMLLPTFSRFFRNINKDK